MPRHHELRTAGSLPACARLGLGTVVYGALGGGVLTGRYRRGETPDPDSRMGRLLGAEPASVALAWVAGRPGVTSVLLGPRSVAQLQAGLAAVDLTLPPEATSHLDELSHTAHTPADGSFFPLVPR